MRILGIDIGGTSIKLCVTNEAGDVELFEEYPSEAKKGGPFLVEKLIDLIWDIKQIDAIGISTAGQVNVEDGSILYANENIPDYTGIQLKSILEETFNLPVYVENDVYAAAMGELYFGNGRNISNFICLTYGTGIGGAIVIDSEVYRGSKGIAAEFGHIITHPFGHPCNCGRQGCYEMYASTTALVKETQKIHPEIDNGRKIFAALEADNEAIETAMDKWLTEVAIGLTTLTHSFNPQAIIVGGGIMEQPYMIQRLQELMDRFLMDSYQDVMIKPAALGNKAGAYGAIAMHLPNVVGGAW